jgi:GTP-sensing pleiotropic transcriptional regulator CodY
MSEALASFRTLKLASTELNRVFTEIGSEASLEGKIILGKHLIPSEKNRRSVAVFDLLNKGLSKSEEQMVRKILRNSDNFA